MEKIKMLEELVGKKVSVWTINSSFKGTVTEVDGEWIKIRTEQRNSVEHILKTDMITSITILP